MTYWTHKEIFYVNSRNRLSGTDSDFTYNLNVNPKIGYDRVVLLDCSIPRSFFMVQENYNTFNVDEGSGNILITLPIGNYTRSSLARVLTDVLNNACSFTYVISYRNIASTYDDGKLVFTVSGNSGVQPSFIFGDGFFELLGFNANTTNTFSGDTLTTTNVINLNHESTLYIHSDICQNQNDNILDDIITSNDSSFSYVVYNNSNPQEFSKQFSIGSNNIFRFTLTDEDNRLINLNGANLLMTIMVYKTNKINELMTGYIKMKTLKENN